MDLEMDRILKNVVTRLFGEQAPAFIEAFGNRIKRVYLKKGDVLYHQGEPGDGMHILFTGRLQVRIAGEARGAGRVVAQLGPGEAVGEIALLTGQDRSATLVALRNSTLGFLKREDFETLMTGHAAAQSHLSNYIIERLLDAQSRSRAAQKTVCTLALVSLDPDIDIHSFCSRLQVALLNFGSVALLDAQTMKSRFPDSFVPGTAGVTELECFVDATENSHDYLLLEVGFGPSGWSEQSAAYADIIVFVTNANTPKTSAERRMKETLRAAGEPRPELELVIVHPPTTIVPQKTEEWLAVVAGTRHLHITLEGESGFDRLARFYSGNAVTLVLGGGGALGFAHIGVLRVLREAGIPIDAVGGTSIGGIVAGGIAMGWNDTRMLAEFKKAFVDDHPTDDYTLPVMSLVQGRKMSDGLKNHFGDIRIEDLWIPFFAVSSSLSHNREYIHRRGLLWRAMRATASLPGIFPPLIEGADLLVDGGILNNLPVDVMKDAIRGHVIAVDLSADENISYEKRKLPTAWEFIKSRIRSESIGPKVPTLHNVILQSTMLGSRREVINARQLADLFLNPPTAGFDLLDWQRFHAISEVGYRYARSKVNAWADQHPELVKRGTVSELRYTGTF
jgi:NTE family protein